MRELPYLYLSEPTAYDLDLNVSSSDYLTVNDTRGAIQQQLETASHMGATVVRIYLNNPNVNTTNVKPALNDLFAFTDYLKDQGRINPNMKYILVLTDFYEVTSFNDLDPSYYTAPYQWLTDEWFSTGYQKQFGSYSSFDAYAMDMINTYNQPTSVQITVDIGGATTWTTDPTLIYAWEIGNEFSTTQANMIAFIQNEGCSIHNALQGSGRLFTSGFISSYHATRGGGSTPDLYNITCTDGKKVFDFGTIHGYNNQWDPAAKNDPSDGRDKLRQLDDVAWFNDNDIPYIVEEIGFTGAYPGADSGDDSTTPPTPPTACVPGSDDSFPLDTTTETDRSPLTQAALTEFFDNQGAIGVMQWAFRAGRQSGALGDSCRGMDSQVHTDWNQMFITYCNQAMALNPSLGLNCNIQASGVDVVIVMDTTGSMGSGIAAAKSVAINYIDQLADSGIDYRAAVVDYKDKRYDPYASRLDLAFTKDQTAISNAINALSATGGGDTPEDVYSGLMTAINLPWRDGSKKVIILMGDAGPLDPEPGTGYTLSSVINAANAVDPASIYAIRIGYNTSMRSAFQQLANGTGGMTFDASNTTSSVSTAILNALNSVAHAPSAVIGENNGQIVGSIGTPIHFDASHSFDVDGFIVQYDWDFNNDGLFDLNSPDPTADYTYTQAYNGWVTLRVHDNDGNTNKVSVKIMVDATGNDTTPPVINITSPLPQAYLHTDSVNISWTATDADSGIASSTGTLDSTAVTNGQTFDLFFLSLGSHTLLVTATDNAGNTATASVTFTIVADINSLIAMEQRACSLGWIDGDGVCNSLEAKLLAAKASIDRGRFNAAKNQLNAFIAELDAQKDKKVTQGYDMLKADAIYVVNSLP